MENIKRAGSKIEIFPKIDDHEQILPVIAKLAAISICSLTTNSNYC